MACAMRGNCSFTSPPIATIPSRIPMMSLRCSSIERFIVAKEVTAFATASGELIASENSSTICLLAAKLLPVRCEATAKVCMVDS
ncbi:hypothetical protein D3C87_1285300 [compost metagenome]